jgi:hypothetical protein
MDKCPHCGMTHDATCSRIKAIEYGPDGTVRRIEFHPPQPVVMGGQSRISPIEQFAAPVTKLEKMRKALKQIGTGPVNE